MLALILSALSVPGLTEAQWAVVEACPRISVPRGAVGAGVVVGVRDGFAYVLTAAHVVKFDGVELAFTSRRSYPKPAWFAPEPEVVNRWPEPDLALIRFRVPEGRKVGPVPLAGVGERPKEYPARLWAVGGGGREASWARGELIQRKRCVRRPGGGLVFFWESDSPPEPGDSGGPLLDSRGRVVGVCSASADGRGYYTHFDEVLVTLKRSDQSWLIIKRP